MIVSKGTQSASPKVQSISRPQGPKSWASAVYQGFKTTAQVFDVYQDIEPYLPDKYIKKYTYKPHKRVAGYLGQTLHAKEKKEFFSHCNQFNQKSSQFFWQCR